MNPIVQLQKFTKLIKNPEDAQNFEDKSIKVERKKWRGSEFTYVYLTNNSYEVGWIVDSATSHCLSCQNSFSIFSRKHHCRSCGIIICNSCSTTSTNIQGLDKYEPKGSRICSISCATRQLKAEKIDVPPVKTEKKSPKLTSKLTKQGAAPESATDLSFATATPRSDISDDDGPKPASKSDASDTDLSVVTLSSEVSLPTPSKGTGARKVKIEYIEKPPANSKNSKYLGVKAAYFATFIAENGGREAFEGKSSGEVCREFIQHTCKKSEVSICKQLRATNSSAVGHAQWFVSHSWSYQFLDTVDAITRKLQIEYGDGAMDIFVWFDLFSLPQLGLFVTHDYLKNTFKETISAIGNVMMVLSSWQDPVALKRAWCVYELFTCKQNDGNFQVAFPRKEVTNVIDFMCSSSSMKQNIFTIDTSKSQAGDVSETELIHTEIRSSIGFEVLDMEVKESIFKVRSLAEDIKLRGEKLEKEGKLELALTHYEEVLMLRSLLMVDKPTLLTAMIYRARAHLKLHGSDEMYVPVLELYKKYQGNQVIADRILKHIKNGGTRIVSLIQLYKDLGKAPSSAVTRLLGKLDLSIKSSLF